MKDLIELIHYQYFINAVLASLLAAVSCGIAGTYVVSRRIVFISGGITHTSFGGIGIGYFFGFNPVLGAAGFSVLSALGIEYFSRKGNIRNDSVIAMLWSLGMAIGVIFIYLTPGYAPNLMTYLFGSILTVNQTDLFLLLGLTLAIMLFFTLFFRRIQYVSFDQEYAASLNLHVGFINYSLMALVALTIVFNIKLVGIILLLSMLTIPQNAANLLTKNYLKIIYLSVLIGFTGSICGLVVSYFLNIPSGATIIFSLVIIYLLIRLVQRIKKVLSPLPLSV